MRSILSKKTLILTWLFFATLRVCALELGTNREIDSELGERESEYFEKDKYLNLLSSSKLKAPQDLFSQQYDDKTFFYSNNETFQLYPSSDQETKITTDYFNLATFNMYGPTYLASHTTAGYSFKKMNASCWLASIGDFNKDGKPDFALGNTWASPLNRTFAGVVYILYGGNDPTAIDPFSEGISNEYGFAISYFKRGY